jgi:hypothetical protein
MRGGEPRCVRRDRGHRPDVERFDVEFFAHVAVEPRQPCRQRRGTADDRERERLANP